MKYVRKTQCLISLLFCIHASVSATEGLNSSAAVEAGEEIISQVIGLGFPAPKPALPSGKEKKGPYKRLVIENANIIDGTGAPTQGPVTIVIENNVIKEINGGGTGSVHLKGKAYGKDTRVIDAKGKYVLPGLIDVHSHLGTPSHAFGGALTDPNYVFKLLLAHGITTVRDVGSFMGLDYTLSHKKRSEQGEISAPRIKAYALFPEKMVSTEAARKWVKSVNKRGADGVKFIGAAPDIIKAALDETNQLNMGSAFHLSQVSVTRTDALDAARMGVKSIEHWYGLPEAMFENKRIQNYPHDYNYNNEQDRFSQAGRLWQQTATPDSTIWKNTISELINLDITLNPTFTIYEAARDLGRAQNAEWHKEYTMPYINRAFAPNPKIHGSFFFDWKTSDEIAWKANYKTWMTFVNDYKNAGGSVAVGSDAGFIYGLYGFNYVRELELLQEAGFHPLEVLQSATINGAKLMGLEKEIGSIELGKKADLVIVNENPLDNFKVLYGTGHAFYNFTTNKMDRTKGIEFTIKDGIVYDAHQLLEDVKEMVRKQKLYESEKFKNK
ncbi:amidohydrolase family protein [Colwellia sp. E150_009]|jgi:imidazolonepropionase-like amidohydrolase